MKKLALVLIALALSACGESSKKLACASPEVQEATIASILETAEAEALTHNQPTLPIDSNGVKSIFSQIKVAIDDTRTDKTQDNKISCAATLKIDIPAVMLNDANAVATLAKSPLLAEVAQKSGLTLAGGTVKKEITFSAQKTDDGKKIKIDLFDLKSIASFPATLAYYTLAKPAVDSKLASDAKAANDVQQAAFDKAKSSNTAANKAINELWKNLPAELQAANMDQEKAWIKQKETTCTAEANKIKAATTASAATAPSAAGIIAPAGASATPAAAVVNYDADIARLNCDTKMTKERFMVLQNLLNQ